MAGSVVVGCAVWSFFQTLSTRQAAYAQVIVIGGGLSIMQVMALVFITELIGENKVSIVKRISLSLDLPRPPTKLSESKYRQSTLCSEIVIPIIFSISCELFPFASGKVPPHHQYKKLLF